MDLFPFNYFSQAGGQWWFDMSPDGERFLMITASGGAEDTSAPPSLVLVQNWFEELRRLVPTN